MDPLVAWENVAREKTCGGLDFTDFHNISKAMKYWSILKLMSTFDTEWVSMVRVLIWKGISKGR